MDKNRKFILRMLRPNITSKGHRPAIVVGLPDRLGNPRFPLVILVPITSDRGQSWANDSPDLYAKFTPFEAKVKSC